MSLWTAQDAAAATGGQCAANWTATGVSIDTRTLQAGDLFVALTAARDGHDFVAQALEKGAAAALVSRVPAGVSADAPMLLVEDVQRGLEALGRAGRARMVGKVLAITGSVGKTSTKEMIAAMLSGQGRTHASVESYNNHWGVPLTLARMPQDTEYAVIEIGMNHPGEIAPLSLMTQPHVALVTTVAEAHLEAFEDIRAIAAEKASIFDGVLANGAAILNADLDTTDILRAKALELGLIALEFGEKSQDFRILQVDIQGATTVARATAQGTPILYKINSPGRHFAANALGAIASVTVLGADLALALSALGLWTPYKGRGQRETIHLDLVDTGMTVELIDDSYNANPASMRAALEVLASAEVTHDIGRVSRGRRIAYLGDMKELGPTAQDLHAALAQLAAMKDIDVVHCIGPLMRGLHAQLPAAKRGEWFETAQDASTRVKAHVDSGDVVLAKGSLSMQLALVVDAIRKMGHAPLNEN